MNSTFVQERIDAFLETEKKCNKELLNQLTLYIYSKHSQKHKDDLYILAKILDNESLIKLVSYFDGDKLSLPTKEDFSKSYLIAIVMYLKEIMEYDWTTIKKLLNLPMNEKDSLSAISIGRAINDLKAEFNVEISKILNNIELDNKEIKQLRKDLDKSLGKK